MDFGLSAAQMLFLHVVILFSVGITLIALSRKRLSGLDTAAGKSRENQHSMTVNIKDPRAAGQFINITRHLLQQNYKPGQPLIILCIGSDRCTGDCVGPLVGSSLTGKIPERFKIHGTLKKPVHALNLKKCLQEIRFKYHHPFIIAIDASLGPSPRDAGTVIINKGKLNPGNAVNKSLPPVGDISIAAVVNDFSNLHSTRLYNVNKIAGFISRGLQSVLNDLQQYSPQESARIS